MHCFRFVAAVFLASLSFSVRGEEPFLKKGDVIALVGGEDMVAASEYGYLELFLHRELPDYQLKFRNLAWEGDTVFEQPRQLNFPSWEDQLAKIGATIVFCQFGKMESLAGNDRLPDFIADYEKLIGRLSEGGKRRIVIIPPTPPPNYVFEKEGDLFYPYDKAVGMLARRRGLTMVGYLGQIGIHPGRVGPRHRDAVHLNGTGQAFLAMYLTELLPKYRPVSTPRNPPVPDTFIPPPPEVRLSSDNVTMSNPKEEALRQVIIAKNRLWFDYWRPQNWAFLNGDRITQPSSRDHRDPNVRWFPAEMEQFLPLIAAKEEEIWKLATELK